MVQTKLNKASAVFDNLLDTKIGRLKDQHKIGICVAVWAVLILAFVFLFFSPKSKEIKGLEANKAQLEAEIRKVEAVVRELDKHEADMRETELKFKAASQLLPEQKEIPSLLANISAQGMHAGLEIVSFKPGGEVAKEFYAEIPVNIQVNGTYHNVGVFLDRVRKLPRLVSVKQLKMGSPKKEFDELNLSTTIDLVTYRFIEPQEQQDAKATKKR